MNILVVDDSRAMRMIIRRTLRQAGLGDHGVTEASSAPEARKLIEAQAPDLILCDWNMPEVTGIELLRQLRADGYTVPFGFITSEASESMKATALEAGAAFFIVKPFEAKTFEDVLTPLLS